MAPTEAVVANDHLALPAGGKNTPLTNTVPISNVQTDIHGLEIWEGTLPIIDLGGLLFVFWYFVEEEEEYDRRKKA